MKRKFVFFGVIVNSFLILIFLLFNKNVKEELLPIKNEHQKIDIYSTIKTKEQLLSFGREIFKDKCNSCHSKKNLSLTNRISRKSIRFVLNNGSKYKLLGMKQDMQSKDKIFSNKTGLVLKEKEIKEIISFLTRKNNLNIGRKTFFEFCASCHKFNGKGKRFIAPNIVDFEPLLINSVLMNGKVGGEGVMPSFDYLSPKQIEALIIYILNLKKKIN